MESTAYEVESVPMGKKHPRLSKADEVRLATEHRSSRRSLVGLLQGLPQAWRERVLLDDCAGEKWPLNQLERAYGRLLCCHRENDSAALDAVVVEAERLKRRIDESRETLVVANLGLVHHVVGRYLNRGISVPDLVQEGYIGLINSVERYDCDLGYRFSTYAVWWIRQSLTRAILEKSRMIRLSRKTWDDVTTVKRTAIELTRLLGRKPTKAEIARDAKLTEQAVDKFLALSYEPGSIENVSAEIERDSSGADEVQPLERVLRREQRDRLISTLGVLSSKEQRLLRLRFGIGNGVSHTLEEIGRVFNVSRERIRQLELGALKKLRLALSEGLSTPFGSKRPARGRRDLKRLRTRIIDEGGKTSERGSSPQPLQITFHEPVPG